MLSVDFIEIDIADAIVSVSAQNIVNRCYDSPTLANSFCPLISRNDDPSSAQSGGLDYLRQVQLNFGAAIFEAFDATASYLRSQSEISTLRPRSNGRRSIR